MIATEEILKNNSYCSNKHDPEYLISFVNKYVKVQLIKNISYCGFVHSIDPVSKSVILFIPKEQDFQTTIIPGHAVEDLSIIPQDNVTSPPSKNTQMPSEEDIQARKKKLIDWFKTYFLPVTENEESIVIGNTELLSPYSSADIYAESPIVALNIRNIMDKMPENFVA